MKFKSHYIIQIIVLAILISSCSEDDDDGPSFSFKDQNLQGSIEGISYNFKDGTVRDGFDDGELFFTLINETESIDEACDLFGPEKVFVIFSIPDQIGVYELSFSLSGSDNQTVSLVDNESEQDFPLTVGATEGAVEILSISETQITGRMDVRADSENYVNGNFTADFCQ